MAGERLTPQEILDFLPQQRPFRFVDRILSVDEQRISGAYTFREDEFFYQGHFPGKPITPGVILLESMCQIGVVALGIYLVALERSREEVGRFVTLFTDAETEFLKPVFPSQTVIVTADRMIWRRMQLRARIEMKLEDGTTVARTVASGMGVRND